MGVNVLKQKAFDLICSMTDEEVRLLIAAFEIYSKDPSKTPEECVEIAEKLHKSTC